MLQTALAGNLRPGALDPCDSPAAPPHQRGDEEDDNPERDQPVIPYRLDHGRLSILTLPVRVSGA